MTKQPISKKLSISPEAAWQAIRQIGRLDVWFPIIASCTVEGAGVGATRRLGLVDGGEIMDTIEAIDDDLMRLVYLRPVSPFPVSYYRGTVEVFRSYDDLAVVVWTIDFEAQPENCAAVAELVYNAISDGLEGMEQDLKSRLDPGVSGYPFD